MPRIVTQNIPGTPWSRYKQRERKRILIADTNERHEAQNRVAIRHALGQIQHALYDRHTPGFRAAMEAKRAKMQGELLRSNLNPN